MTDLTAPGSKNRRAHHPIQLDMTPMVDLAFLLLTFFILTTTLISHRSLEVRLPPKGPPSPLPEAKALTLLVCGNNRLYWYQGGETALSASTLHPSGYSESNPTGLRSILSHWNSAVARDTSGLTVLIKSEDKARFKNLVDVLDEMLVCNVRRYAMAELSGKEVDLVHALRE